MARQLWVDYDELKRLTTQLGCIMLDDSDRGPEVERLCQQITAKIAAIQAGYHASATHRVRTKITLPRPSERKALKRWLFGF